jgi:creatinine amidohydrolase
VRDVIIGLGRGGIRRMVIACGHFENVWPCIEAIDLALRDLLRDGIDGMTVLRLEYWDHVRRETHDRLFPEGFPSTELEHAALLQTSMILKLRPDIVDMSKVPSDGPAQFPAYDRYPKVAGYLPPSGC